MELTGGSTLGAYEIIEPLGEGGMGEVYRARDSRLHRDVALKIIHRQLTFPDSLVRFRREARVLASLSHPNVAHVFEFDELPEAAFIVMELVPGETLADRLARGCPPIAEVVRIAQQVAAALDAVHERGIIHRDLKPANIKITGEGVVKVLDFGLAKYAERSVQQTEASTIVGDNTRAGTVLGTAAYMSPEQARGLEVDRRTDIWSFGCVVFEMLTGRRPFAATTVAETIAKVLERDVDWSLLPPSTPPGLVRLLRRCLVRDPQLRLRDIGDAHFELEDASARAEEGGAATRDRRRWRTRAALIAGAALSGALLTGAASLMMSGAQSRGGEAARFVMALPPTAQLAGLDFPSLAVAPDGSNVVFVATRGSQTQLFVRPLAGLESRPLPGTANAVAPFFSPDGRWVGFFAGGELRKIALSGGNPVTLCEAPVGLGGSWNEADEIVFAAATGSGISRVSAFGGRPERISTLDETKGEFSHRWPEWLPGGKTILYTVGTVGSWNDAQIVAQSVSTGQRTIVAQGGTNPRYSRSGHLFYAHDGAIMRATFDAARSTMTGSPATFLEHVLQSSDGAAQFAISARGHAAYVEGAFEAGGRRLVMVGRDGVVTPLAAPARPYQWPRVSPDGQRVLVTIEGSPSDVWLYDLRTSSFTQITFDAGASFATWSADGEHVVFTATRNGAPNLFMTSVVQPAPIERIVASGQMQIAGSSSLDGTLVFVERREETGRDILLLSPDRAARTWLASSRDETAPRLSPDGRSVAYVSNEPGHDEVFVRALSGSDRAIAVSSGGGGEPVWSTTARELFYRGPEGLMRAVFDGATAREARSQLLFKEDFAAGTIDAANYDVMPDGQRFIMLQRDAQGTATLHFLMNWLDRPLADPSR